MKKICILFAGPIGSGKSPIANYLSYKLDLPVFNNDLIRIEVKEDLLKMDEKEYVKRRTERVEEILELGIDFIYDACIDRKWSENKNMITERGYSPFIISLDFSKEKLIEIYKAKGYTAFEALNKTFEEHKHFTEKFKDDIGVRIEDSQFKDRLNTVFAAARDFINS